MKPEEIQKLVNAAVSAKEEEIERRLRSELEREQETMKMRITATALNEGSHLYLDPMSGYSFCMIPLDKIDYNPLSRRTDDELEPENDGIQQLIGEIHKRGGLNRPLLVYRLKGENEGRYMLVKGARRLAALKAMGEELTHAYVMPAKPPIDMEERWVNGY